MKLIYLVGLPGSGKTVVLDEALRVLDLPAGEVVRDPVPHVRYGDLWYLGVRRESFGGTDALSMSINPKAVDFLPAAHSEGCSVLVGEGDRLANAAFLKAWTPTEVIYLDTPIVLARERARLRAEYLGRPEQSPSWWKGRVTKVDNLTARLPHHRLDGRLPLEDIGFELSQIIARAARHERAR